MTREAAERQALELNARWHGRGARYVVMQSGAGEQASLLDGPQESATGGWYVRREKTMEEG